MILEEDLLLLASDGDETVIDAARRSGACGSVSLHNWDVEDGTPRERDLQAQIDAIVQQVMSNRRDIVALGRRADASEDRADASEARADAAELRAEVSEAQALVDRDMIAELQRDGVVSREHAAQMEEALKSSRTVGTAIGVIMASRGLSAEAAFEVLQKASQHSNRKLREIAADLVDSRNP